MKNESRRMDRGRMSIITWTKDEEWVERWRGSMSIFTWTKDEEWVEGWIEVGWVYSPELRMKNEKRIGMDRGRMSIFTWTKDEELEKDRDG